MNVVRLKIVNVFCMKLWVTKSSFISLPITMWLLYCFEYWALFNEDLTITTQICAPWKLSTLIPGNITENIELTECSSNGNRKAITTGKNMYSIGLNNQWKLNEITISTYTSFGKPITHKTLWIALWLTHT